MIGFSTGLALSRAQVEGLVAADPGRIVVVDEAYVDFGGESVLDLIDKYDNLLVCRTFSKSRSLAGARLGFGAACPARIAELERVRCSVNPYNVNRMTMAAAKRTQTHSEAAHKMGCRCASLC